MKKQKLTRNQFRKMIQEEISNLAENNYHEIGAPPNPKNNLGMGSISEDEEEGENKPPESALRKLAGSDEIKGFLDLYTGNRGKSGNWIVRKVGDRVELRPTVDFAQALSKWFIRDQRDPAWTIEFREATEEDSMDESKKITKGMVLKMLREEFQNVMFEDDDEDDAEENAISHAWLGADHDREEEEGVELTEFAESIAALETMHQNLEGIIDRLKEVPGAPLGTDIAMALSGLDEQEREEQ